VRWSGESLDPFCRARQRKASFEKAPEIQVRVKWAEVGISLIYLKSFLVGFAAVFVVFVLIPLLVVFGQVAIFAAKGFALGGFGIELGRFQWQAPSLTAWLLMLTVFGIAFTWQYRRLARSQ
jgi:hypothetical protein